MSTLALPAGTLGSFTSRDPLEQAILGYLAAYKGRTLDCYKQDLKVFLAFCENQQLHPLEAKRPHLELYLRWMEDHPARWSESTISRRFGTVAGFYKAAVRDDLIVKDPTLSVKRPQVDRDKQRRTFLPPVEFATLLKHSTTADPMEAALMAILCLRGLRIAEACSLDVTSIGEHQGHRVIRYISKGGKARTHVLPAQAIKAVERAIGDRTEGPLLLNQWGNRMNRKNAGAVIKRLCRAAGVDEDQSPHSMRRSFITTGLVTGINLYDMQRTVGHASPATTAIYDRLANDLNRDKSHEVAGFLSALGG
jgi:integrase/recombinase XerD